MTGHKWFKLPIFWPKKRTRNTIYWLLNGWCSTTNPPNIYTNKHQSQSNIVYANIKLNGLTSSSPFNSSKHLSIQPVWSTAQGIPQKHIWNFDVHISRQILIELSLSSLVFQCCSCLVVRWAKYPPLICGSCVSQNHIERTGPSLCVCVSSCRISKYNLRRGYRWSTERDRMEIKDSHESHPLAIVDVVRTNQFVDSVIYLGFKT